jgi:hypothetical protein
MEIKNKKFNWHKCLFLNSQELTVEFYKLSNLYHPDKNGTNNEFIDLKYEYETLQGIIDNIEVISKIMKFPPAKTIIVEKTVNKIIEKFIPYAQEAAKHPEEIFDGLSGVLKNGIEFVKVFRDSQKEQTKKINAYNRASKKKAKV